MKGTHMGSLAKNAPKIATGESCYILGFAEDDADVAAIRHAMATASNRQIAEWLHCSASTVGDHKLRNCVHCYKGGAA